ncbi:MAG: nucleoside hydrolase [Prevotella sp.]|nr:nucleoside hydrolase [Prevotella sp.]
MNYYHSFQRMLLLVLVWMSGLCMSLAGNRTQVIIDNDFAGDPDGLYALAQLLRSPSVDVRAIIGSHLHEVENWVHKGRPSAQESVDEVRKLMQVMGTGTDIPVVRGSEKALADTLTPIASDGARRIVDEAMAHDKGNPLYVLCGGGLTEMASAWLLQPDIARRIILIWIGGDEYPGVIPAPGNKPEYNTTIDVKAAQVIFNRSDITVWQIPRNAYRQCLVSYSTLRSRMKGSVVADYLLKKLEPQVGPDANSEAYVLGDSPLVLLTALQSNWERDPCSSVYTLESRPTVGDDARFSFGESQHKVRVYGHIDTYLMFEDMFSKLF